ncbi:hypothetical protein BDW71DRAFT_179885 [Aspergillus fruticulosus]
MFAKFLAAAAILGLSLVDAHMVMTNPVPYNFKSWNNSPVAADGSDFPCKETDYTVTKENYLTKGQEHVLEFQGSATHGGGSCQISITSDRAPTKDTQWSVIKSIEGGCMDPDEGGTNQSGGAGKKNAFRPSFTIPDDFEDGQYTLAWTWINRIGIREFYMNCAPITISGGPSTKRSDVGPVEKRSQNYPPMFIANINGCKTEENTSPRFPNPGSVVDSYNEAHLIADASNVCHKGSPTWGTAGFSTGGGSVQPTLEGNSAGASSTPAAPTEATTATSGTATAPSVSIGGAVAVPDFTGEPAAAVPTPSSTFVSVAAPTAAPTSSPSTSTNSAAGALSGSCTDDGAWNCVGGSSFQRCASGTWTDVQILASGTECTPGQNMNLAVKAVQVKSRMLKEKRSRRRAHGHINIHS